MGFAPMREQRFAVVLYGGVSLAIYMNGVAQELLRMVRATAPDAGPLDEVEKVYRQLAEAVPNGPARFVIDILSGTSAGGINGVALAKALVAGNRNLDCLRDAWVEKSQIDDLLNDRSILPGAAPASLLDGRYMYRILAETLRKMNSGTGPLADVLELYVTATDLRGRDAPIQLTGTRINEPVHKTVFRFRHDAAEGGGDFGPDCDRMLAFAARCTSSFPVAFEPMRFGDIRPTDAERTRYAAFFPGRIEDHRQYADGGYLDNRPFSYAIEAIPVMPRALPGERILFFVDPFPETENDPVPDPADVPVRPYDFLENAKLAATTLPRRETIRDDIRAINRINQRLDRLGSLMARRRQDETNLGLRDRPKRIDPIEKKDLRDLVVGEGYGECYAPYHHLRVYGATDALANLVASLGGYERRSDEWQYLRQLVRAWRDQHFSAYHAAEHETETAFLSAYDIDFRVRRLNDLRDFLDVRAPKERLPELRAEIETQLGVFRRLLRTRQPRELGIADDKDLRSLRKALEDSYGAFVAGMKLEERYEVATETYRANRAAIDTVMDRIRATFGGAFENSSAEIRRRAVGTAALVPYEDFHWRDVATFPFLEGTSAEEHCEVRIYRISPVEDDSLNDSPKKLAGIAVGAFGGFLSRDWRQHDILWGRLDAAARIVTAVLPGSGLADKRKEFVGLLHEAILRQEFGGADASERRLALIRAKLKDTDVSDDIRQDLHQAVGTAALAQVPLDRFKACYARSVPLGPAPRDVARWGSRSASILAKMIDDLEGAGFLGFAKGRVASSLRAGGVLSAQLARFAMPGTFARSLAEHVLFVAIAAGILLTLAGPLIGIGSHPGLAILAASVCAWAALYITGRVFRGKSPLWTLPVGALAVAVVVFATLGIDAASGRAGLGSFEAIEKLSAPFAWVRHDPMQALVRTGIVLSLLLAVWTVVKVPKTARSIAWSVVVLVTVGLAVVGAQQVWDRVDSPSLHASAAASTDR